MSADDNKLESIDRKFTAQFFSFLLGDGIHVTVPYHLLRLRTEQRAVRYREPTGMLKEYVVSQLRYKMYRSNI
jgi:hypothetical protein